MIAVSEAWKTTHTEKLLPETFIEIGYSVSEPGLQQDSSASANYEEAFSEAETLVDTLSKTSEKYATLEWNSFGLDGSFEYFDGTPEDPGYVATPICDENGVFMDIPMITISFSKVHTNLIPGITITWSETYEEWASKFRVTSYRDGVATKQYTVEDNTSIVAPVSMDLQDFDAITIEILEWSHPYHRTRAIDVFAGIKSIYTKNDLLNFSHTQTVDLLSASLPVNKITFGLRNEDSRWNPDNPTGVEKYLLEQQEITVRYGMIVNGSTEWIDGGRFWLSEWNTPANGLEASFTAKDALEFMHEVYTGTRSGTLYEIAEAAFVQANMPVMADGSNRYVIDSVLNDYSTDFSDKDDDYTVAEVIQMIAHMGGCVLHQDRSGVIYLRPRQIVLRDYQINQNVSYSHPEFDISKPLKAVVVNYGDNQKATVSVGTAGEVQTVDNPFIKTKADAERVGRATQTILEGRKTISGEFRADPRMDALDIVEVQSKYATNIVTITDITYSTTGGAMRGKFTGRVDV